MITRKWHEVTKAGLLSSVMLDDRIVEELTWASPHCSCLRTALLAGSCGRHVSGWLQQPERMGGGFGQESGRRTGD